MLGALVDGRGREQARRGRRRNAEMSGPWGRGLAGRDDSQRPTGGGDIPLELTLPFCEDADQPIELGDAFLLCRAAPMAADHGEAAVAVHAVHDLMDVAYLVYPEMPRGLPWIGRRVAI